MLSNFVELDTMTSYFVKKHSLGLPDTDTLVSWVFVVTCVAVADPIFTLGCCMLFFRNAFTGQRRTQRMLNVLYFGLYYALSFTFLLYAACVSYVYIQLKLYSVSESVLRDCMDDTLYTYLYFSKSWDKLQFRYECCGVDNYTDWFNVPIFDVSNNHDVPDSCCKTYASNCGKNVSDVANIYQNGCLKSLGIHIRGQVLVSTTYFQIICISFIAVFAVSFYVTFSYTCSQSREYFRNNDNAKEYVIENAEDLEPSRNDDELEPMLQDHDPPNVIEGPINANRQVADDEENNAGGNENAEIQVIVHQPDENTARMSDDDSSLDIT